MNSEAIIPVVPSAVEVVMYGKNDWPSKRADEALKEDETSEPDTRSIRSCSMIELDEWSSCKGTNFNWEILVVDSNPESGRIHKMKVPPNCAR